MKSCFAKIKRSHLILKLFFFFPLSTMMQPFEESAVSIWWLHPNSITDWFFLPGFARGETTSEIILRRIQRFYLGQAEFAQFFKRKQKFPWFSALSEYQVSSGGRKNIQDQLIGVKGSLKISGIDSGDAGIMDDGNGFMEVNSQLNSEYWVILVALSKGLLLLFYFLRDFWTETTSSAPHTIKATFLPFGEALNILNINIYKSI